MSEANRLITQAMAVLEEAHGVADAIRADADRYARDRRTEADLLLGKARRVLLAAESKAEAIVGVARGAAAADRPGDAEPDTVIDLDALAADLAAEAALVGPTPESSLDRLLDAAIARAVTRALPDHAPH